MQVLKIGDFNSCLEYVKKHNHEYDEDLEVEGFDDNGVKITCWRVVSYSFEEIYAMNGGTY